MARTLACPAWLGRCATSGDIDPPEKKWTADGTKAHAVLAGEDEDEELDDALEMAVKMCREKEQMMLVGIGFEDYEEVVIEKRLWLHDDAGNEVASGQSDKVYFYGRRFAVTDYKTGRKDAIPPAMNPQLILLALLVQEHYGLSEGFIGIVPAWRKTPPMAQINAEQLAEWKAAILAAIGEAASERPRAEAGPHCDYCPFRWRCPEAWQLVEDITKVSLETIMQESPDIILQHFTTAEHASKTIEAFREQLRAMLAANPDAVPGIHIGKPSEMKTIPGSEAAWAALTERYSLPVLLAATKWTPAALAKSITGGKGAALVKKQLEEELDPWIVKKPKSGSLERVA